MLLSEKIPSSNSHIRLVWRVVSAGEEQRNERALPSVVGKRWLIIVGRTGTRSGTLTVSGGVDVPEAPEGIFWDTIATVSVSSGSVIIQDLSNNFPYHYYKVNFTPNQGNEPIDIFVIIEGNV